MSKPFNAETAKAGSYLDTLCSLKPGRRLGSSGNRAATDFFVETVEPWGYDIDATPFPCQDFECDGASLTCDGRSYEVAASPFTTGCDVTAGLVVASTIAELRKCRPEGKILLMKGGLCAERLMPRDYPFFYPEHHKRIIGLLDRKQPAAIVAATAKNPALSGAVYPFPLFEDGNFDIPSAYCTDAIGEAICPLAGKEARLSIDAWRIPSRAANVVARKNPGSKKRIVACAHIDTKPATPGALDNASGIVTLLLLAEMLRDYGGKTGVDLVAINGEEHYSAAGELDYLRRYCADYGRISLVINVDGMGYVKGATAFSLYGLPEAMERKAREAFGAYRITTEGEPWYAGDHMVFARNGVPTIALTSELAAELTAEVIHTAGDTPGIVDCGKLVEAARALDRLVRAAGGRA